jgi:hypothetical protein
MNRLETVVDEVAIDCMRICSNDVPDGSLMRRIYSNLDTVECLVVMSSNKLCEAGSLSASNLATQEEEISNSLAAAGLHHVRVKLSDAEAKRRELLEMEMMAKLSNKLPHKSLMFDEINTMDNRILIAQRSSDSISEDLESRKQKLIKASHMVNRLLNLMNQPIPDELLPPIELCNSNNFMKIG